MLSFVVAFSLLPAVFCGTLQFALTSEFDVDSQFITVPQGPYNGTVVGTLTPLHDQDLMLCVSWLVPPEAPVDADLQTIWPTVCDFAQNFSKQANPQPYSFTAPLRTGVNYFTLAIVDYDSTGLDEYDLDLDYEIGTCGAVDQYGPSCSLYTSIVLGASVPVVGANQFLLPTTVNSTKYVQNLKFSFTGNLTGSSLSYRLSAPATLTELFDGNCPDLSKGCQIVTPPMTRSDSFWTISITGDNLTFSVNPTLCNNNIGKDCKNTLINGSKVTNSVSQYTGSQYFVFSGKSFDVAVGGLDGFTQTAEAPSLTVQIDNVPSLLLSSGIGSKSNRLTINMVGSDVLLDDSQFIVFVNAKGSFGIWIPTENTTCASNCSSRGECTDYVCECPSSGKPKYNGLGCEHQIKNFTVEYIILIAVGGLLVLAIVIGVPVYCWMNRHSDYETVA
jgi:hypothetical protein